MDNYEFNKRFNALTNGKFESLRINAVELMMREAKADCPGRLGKVNVIVTFLVPFAVYTELMTDANKTEITNALQQLLPSNSRLEIRYKKSYVTPADVMETVNKYVSEQYPVLKTQLNADSVKVRRTPDGFEVALKIEPFFAGMVKEGDIAEKLRVELNRNFTDSFSVTIDYLSENIVRENDEVIVKDEFFADKNEIAFTRDNDGAPLFGKYLGTVAHTIKSRLQNDGKFETICGQIKSLRSGLSKAGRRYCVFRLYDKTGEIGVKYFSRTDKETPLDKLKEGDEVVCTGNIAEERENEKFPTKYPARAMSLTALDYCKVDYDSVARGKVFRKLPEHYVRAFPQPIPDPFENEFNDVLYEKKPLNPYLKGEFVVFDLETTGLKSDTDYIIEIGAVLLKDGVITEQFGTFVKPPIALPPGISELTHITDEMLVDAPEIQDVLGDFYKFTSGRTLIAYNADFDVSFIRKAYDDYRYKFENRYDDALEMAKKASPGTKHTLEFMCELYGIFYPVKHRAVGDAMVTAELVKRIKRDEMK